MVNIYLISDTHFGHENIIKCCNRPFRDAAEMDEALVSKWNDIVRPQDHVYHLGDVAMSRQALHAIMPRLHGHKRLVLGNHDNQAPMLEYAKYFEKIMLWRLFKPVVLSHVPVHIGSFGKALVNVHGHIHDHESPCGPYVNVSCEMTDYAPIHLDRVMQFAAQVQRFNA